MRTFKKAEEEDPRHTNRVEKYDFMNTIIEVLNLTTKNTLAILEIISNIKETLATPLKMFELGFNPETLNVMS